MDRGQQLKRLWREIDQMCRLPHPRLEPLPPSQPQLASLFQQIEQLCGRAQLPVGGRLTGLDDYQHLPELLLPTRPVVDSRSTATTTTKPDVQGMMQEMETLLSGAMPPFRLGDLEHDDEIPTERRPITKNGAAVPCHTRRPLLLERRKLELQHKYSLRSRTKPSCLVRIRPPSPAAPTKRSKYNRKNVKKAPPKRITGPGPTSPPRVPGRIQNPYQDVLVVGKKPEKKRAKPRTKYKLMADFMESGYSSSQSSVPSPSASSGSSSTSSASSLVSNRNPDGKLIYFCDQYEHFVERRRRCRGRAAAQEDKARTLAVALDKVLQWTTQTLVLNHDVCPSTPQRPNTPPVDDQLLDLDGLGWLDHQPPNDLEPKSDGADFDQWLTQMCGF